jgi:hypothetical protein
MSLLNVHKVLIMTAILLCVGFALRDVATGDASTLAMLRVTASMTGAIVLGLYLRWLVRAQGRVMDAAALRDVSRRDNEVQSSAMRSSNERANLP